MPVSMQELRGSTPSGIIRRHRLVVVLRRVEPMSRLLDIATALAADGVRVLEITMDGPDSAAQIAAVRAEFPDGGPGAVLIGAGTVRSAAQLAAAIDAGAAFGVSPVFQPEVLAAAIDAGLPFIPGAYSPTEADAAWRAGATFVKLFPASSLGPDHVRELRGPLGEIEVIPTGGIDATNARAFLDAGAVAVGIGSAIVRADPAERRRIVDAVAGAR